MIRERLVHIHYEDEVMKGEDNGLIKAFYNTLGKISSYGLNQPSQNGALDYLSIRIDRLGNISASLYTANDSMEELKKTSQLWEVLPQFQQQEPRQITAKIDDKETSYVIEVFE